MTTRDIISKLTSELDKGITTEAQAVYLLVGIRKIIERDKIGREYADLRFHCDWALHSSLDRTAAIAILKKFDAAHAFLRGNIKPYDLPPALRTEIDRISKMKLFEREFSGFLGAYGLPPLTKCRSDGWAHFLHLYAKVIEDIPLVVKDAAITKHISRVVLHFEEARKDVAGEVLFKVTWTIHDKNGQSGAIFVINSYTRNG